MRNDTARVLAVIAGIVVVAVIAAVLILSLGGGGNSVSLQHGWSSSAPTAVEQMQSLVANNQQ
jgi:hypothetical protein